MRGLGRVPRSLLWGLLLWGSTELTAQEAPELALEQLGAMKVRSAPGVFQPVADSPAITTTITWEDLQTAGYGSVAEALALVPGFYGINDWLGENIGVRGVNAGPRAYSRILKVMIDGQPVASRADATTLLGPELIPMEAIDRIEVTRGPASALYGADAFLGTVQIITKAYARRFRGSLVARGSWLGKRFGGGGESLIETGGEHWGFLASAGYREVDRSGLWLPEQSPILRSAPPAVQESRRDFSAPGSLLLKGAYFGEDGAVTELTGHFSRASAHAEWADFAPLSPSNKVVSSNAFLRLRTRFQPTESFEGSAYLAVAQGGPDENERLASTSPRFALRREMDYHSLDLGAEGKFTFRQRDSLLLGVDQTRDRHQLMRVLQIDLTSGQETPATLDQGQKVFTRTGAYLQLLAHGGEDLDFTANVRQDHQNVYGSTTSHRVSLVYRFSDAVYGKVVNGTSYKAPSPYQLYGQPLYFMEFQGNPNLGTEGARTSEVEFGWEPSSRVLGKLNAFQNEVDHMIVLVPKGAFIPENAGRQRSSGLEGELRVTAGRQLFHLTASTQHTRDFLSTPFQGEQVQPAASYPRLTAAARWEFRTQALGTLELGARYASRRRASLSNIQTNYYTPYSLPAYTVCHAAYALPWRAGRLHLRVNNLFNVGWAEPGYRGFDIPSRPREIQLTFGWRY